jgi:hypothetical protein
MAKAWRNIKGNGGKRPQYVPTKGGNNWLLQGLLLRGGYIQKAEPIRATLTERVVKWFRKLWKRA